MNKVMGLFLFLSISEVLYSQDLVVTRQKDSLDCQITLVNLDMNKIYIRQLQNGIIHYRSFKFEEVYSFQKSINQDNQFEDIQTRKFAGNIQSGLAIWHFSVSQLFDIETKKEFNSLRVGWCATSNIQMNLSEKIGFGLQIQTFSSNGKVFDREYSANSVGVDLMGNYHINKRLNTTGWDLGFGVGIHRLNIDEDDSQFNETETGYTSNQLTVNFQFFRSIIINEGTRIRLGYSILAGTPMTFKGGASDINNQIGITRSNFIIGFGL